MIFTPESMAAAVKTALDTQVVLVPPDKTIVLFAGVTTEGGKVAM